MTTFPTVSFTSTSEILTLSCTWGMKKVPFSGWASPHWSLGSFSIDDGDGSEKSLLKWFALFQPLSRLFQFTEKMEFGRISLELISWGPDSSVERERKIRRRLFTLCINGEIRHFHVVVVQKGVMHVQSCCCANQTYCFFLPFLLPSPSSLLKLPIRGTN